MRRADSLKCLLAVLALAAGPLAEAAGVYKRTDESGRKVYTDKNYADSERITRKYLVNREIPPRDLSPPPAEFVIEIATACVNHRDRVASYRASTELFARDPGGNRVPLSERQRALMIAHAEQEAERLCRPQAADLLWAEFKARVREERGRR